jgi:hypothetical protein
MIGQVRQDGLVVDCATLVDWARVASTLGPVDANRDLTVPLAIKELRVPLADERLAAWSWTWVLEDLPVLGRTGTTLERQFLQQNAVLRNLLQQQVDDANATQQADRAPKTFSSVYPPTSYHRAAATLRSGN